ncbi:MAG: DUF494 family protein [Bacteroidota bacterium]|nr:DUF494 family protein [Bacteroidota bacterium]MDP4229224.1 DUF494 family protein [Bacteroidota bacterium]MDP4236057.1 DUF494 family protein [Bacteroidota bacterium]
MKVEDVSSRALKGTGRVMEVILFLVGEMRRNKQLGEIDLGKLAEKGYTEMEVSTAFSWLFDKMALSVSQSNVSDISHQPKLGNTHFRVYHDLEQSFLSSEARGYLLQLRELGLLKDSEMELLVDRLWFIGLDEVGIDNIRDLAAAMIFDFEDSSRTGSRMMLNVTDRVQ